MISPLAGRVGSGACLPLPPRHTWATTAPLLSGTRPCSRSRLISAATDLLPRSAAIKAPASRISISPPRPPRRDGGLARRDQVGVNGGGQAGLSSHTESVHLYHSNGITRNRPDGHRRK